MNKTIGEIAKELDIKPVEIIKKLKDLQIDKKTVGAVLSVEEQNRLYSIMRINRGMKKPSLIKKDEKPLEKKPGLIKKVESKEGPEKPEKPKAPGERRTIVTVIKKAKPEPEVEAKPEDKESTAAAPVEPPVLKEIEEPKPIDMADAKPEEKEEAQTKTTEEKPSPQTTQRPEGQRTHLDQRPLQRDGGRIPPRRTDGPLDNRPRHPQGGSPPRPFDRRPPQQGFPKKELAIPKPDAVVVEKKEKSDQTWKGKKTSHKKDLEKNIKRENRKEPAKAPFDAVKNEKAETSNVINTGKVHLKEALSEEFILNEFYSDNNVRRTRRKRKTSNKPIIEVLRHVQLPEQMTVKQFAETIKKQISDVIAKLMSLDILATINDEIDYDTATLIAEEYGITTELAATVTEEDILFHDETDSEGELKTRPPVVVVMGHVDHGKTSLLDAIKKTNVVATEAGNITQHIGAYMVRTKKRDITFLDTPGHEAFTAMRKRGAQVTDVAIIVVAADDGIMPQTVEAINHAKAANVTVIVAINKIDLPSANPDRVMQELTEHGLVSEAYGGDVICVPVSAKTGENIDHLLDMIILSADMLELRVNPNRQAKGTVIESRIDRAGVMTTLLVQRGTLKVGEYVICGVATGRIRAMKDDKGKEIMEAGPSVPVEIMGLDVTPEAGETFYAVQNEKTARSLAERRKHEIKQEKTVRIPSNLDDLFIQIQEGKIKELNLIIKADVRGSVEALHDSLQKINNEEVKVKVVHSAVGTISESDVSLAEVSNAIIIGFNVRPGNNVVEAAKHADVDIRLYRVIYDAIDDIKSAIKGMLSPKYTEVVTGHVEVRQIYKVSGVGTIAGCMVTDGKISRNSDVRLLRDGIIAYEGKLASLKRFKDDAKEVTAGYECGISIEKYNDLKEGDIIEGYAVQEVAPK
ncbi:MAG: translation initiation factor IF-2 [Clostridia bacterium]